MNIAKRFCTCMMAIEKKGETNVHSKNKLTLLTWEQVVFKGLGTFFSSLFFYGLLLIISGTIPLLYAKPVYQATASFEISSTSIEYHVLGGRLSSEETMAQSEANYSLLYPASPVVSSSVFSNSIDIHLYVSAPDFSVTFSANGEEISKHMLSAYTKTVLESINQEYYSGKLLSLKNENPTVSKNQAYAISFLILASASLILVITQYFFFPLDIWGKIKNKRKSLL